MAKTANSVFEDLPRIAQRRSTPRRRRRGGGASGVSLTLCSIGRVTVGYLAADGLLVRIPASRVPKIN